MVRALGSSPVVARTGGATTGNRTQEPSFSQSRLRFFCFGGIFSPSRRQMRSTRLWFTFQPAWFSRAVTGL
jgi:hypothetical protein